MLACDLFVRAGNGETSLLYPLLEKNVGEKTALIHHLTIVESEPEFKEWYQKESQSPTQTGGQLDINGEPVLIDNAYFENTSGEKWFLDEQATFVNGEITKTPIRYTAQDTREAFDKALNSSSFPELQQRVAQMMGSQFSFYRESEKPNLLIQNLDATQVQHELATNIFLPHQVGIFLDIMADPSKDRELDAFEMLHPETKKPLTFLEHYFLEFDRLQREQDFLHETSMRIQLSPFMEASEFAKNKDALYQKYLSLPYQEHVSEDEFADFWRDEIAMDDTKLNDLWSRMAQKTGSSHKMLRQNFGALYRQISDEVTQRMMETQVKRVYGASAKLEDHQQHQSDIWEGDKYFRSIVDFGENQLGMQRLALMISNATGIAENEVQRNKDMLNRKMTAVAEHYWAGKPERSKMAWLVQPFDTIKRFFNRVNRHNEPYLWMLERERVPVDPNDPLAGFTDGEYTGNMIERFSRTEESVRNFVFEKGPAGEYIRTIQELFDDMANQDKQRLSRFMTVKEHKQLFRFIEDYENFTEALKNGAYLTSMQRKKLERIQQLVAQGASLNQSDQDFLDWYMEESKDGLTLTKKQERYKELIESKGRYLVARALAVQEDSVFFKDLEALAASGNQEAQAKIDLYDYLYRTNLDLAEDNDNSFNQPLDRAFMPQLSMNVYETYYRTKSFWNAYLKFTANLDNSDLFGHYQVEGDGGQTMSWNEWIEYYKDPARTKAEKLKAPFKLMKMKRELEKQWANGKSPDPMNRKQFTASFSISNKMPFRTVAKKDDFTINVSRMFMVHFESLIFRKHHNRLVPLFQAVQTHYDQKGRNQGKSEAFKNMITYIDDYVDRYMFGRRRGDFNNSVIGTTIDRLLTATTLAYLSVSPKTSVLNLAVGMNEALRQKVAEHGWASGAGKFATGLKRMGQPGIIKGVAKGEGFNMLSKKAKAFIQHYNLETFTNIDIENQQDFMFGMADHMMYLQKQTEVIIRGTSILGEMTDAEWNSFDVNENGYLVVTDPQNFPKVGKVKEWNYYVSSVQGNYTPEGRRNYHNFVVFKSAMLFKTWMVNFVEERLRPTYTDNYGKKRQGYYLTLPQVIWSYTKVISNYRDIAQVHGKLKPHQQQNLRKIAYDLSMFTLLAVATGFGDDEEEDPSLAFLKDLMLNYQTQLFFLFDAKEILGIISRPFPWMGMLESWAGAASNFWDGKFGKSAELIGSTIPGNRAIDFAQSLYDMDETE